MEEQTTIKKRGRGRPKLDKEATDTIAIRVPVSIKKYYKQLQERGLDINSAIIALIKNYANVMRITNE